MFILLPVIVAWLAFVWAAAGLVVAGLIKSISKIDLENRFDDDE